mgnify:FL=1
MSSISPQERASKLIYKLLRDAHPPATPLSQALKQLKLTVANDALFFAAAPDAVATYLMDNACTVEYQLPSDEEGGAPSTHILPLTRDNRLDVTSLMRDYLPVATMEELTQKDMAGYERFTFVDPATYALVIADPLTASSATRFAVSSFRECASSPSVSRLPRSFWWAARMGLATSTKVSPVAIARGAAAMKLSAIIHAALEEALQNRGASVGAVTSRRATCLPSMSELESASVEEERELPKLNFVSVVESSHQAAGWRGRWRTTGSGHLPACLNAAVDDVVAQRPSMTPADAVGTVATPEPLPGDKSGVTHLRCTISLRVNVQIEYHEDGSCHMSSDVPVEAYCELPTPIPAGALCYSPALNDGTVDESAEGEAFAAVHKYGSRLARRLAKQLEASEAEATAALQASCAIELGDTVMRSVRRKLPVTRQPFDFRKMQTREAFAHEQRVPSARSAAGGGLIATTIIEPE